MTRYSDLVFRLAQCWSGDLAVGTAIDANSREAKGIAGALRVIQRQQFGSVLLGATAAGFVVFGIYGVALVPTARSLLQHCAKRKTKSE